ncbi:uncharacterized protein LOC129908803 isoform X1 [Episyrphus balteatus]|uniref:uncharacterized protein LOC129908803 isoform X1 n=1 Tax=Episyrphus balteatus TaxID=286459 RepID=UPI00248629A8|nr:uncharacterized protein LOC129908803 isoform X1 [Episyrphus balteatus]
MSDIIIKSENEDNDDSNDSLSALTTLLKEVKKEEHPEVLSDNETQTENNKGSETLPESFFDDLYRDELEAGPAEATTDADIAKLQEIIARKKRILHDVSEDVEGGDGPLDNRCKRKDKTNDGDKQSGNGAKRSRTTLDTSEDAHPNNNADEGIDQNNTTQPSSSSANECPEPSEEAADPEMELEKLLKTEDYYSNEEVSNPNQNIQFSNNNMQQMYGFPNGMGMMPTMYNPGATQMMGNMPPGGYPMMPNMGFPPGFYPPNMVNMQMMGYGFPQINVPSNNNEVECLPVDTSAGLPKITFKKIKLEKSVDKTVPPAEDPRKKETFNGNTTSDKSPSTSAARMRRLREKRKADDPHYVSNETKRIRELRKKQREEAPLHVLEAKKKAERDKKRMQRAKKRAEKWSIDKNPSLSTSTITLFETKNTLNEDINKAVAVLPKCPRKQKEVVTELAQQMNIALLADEQKVRLSGVGDIQYEVVKNFYYRSDIVYTCPGENDVVVYWEDGIKKKSQKHYLIVYLREAFSIFKEFHPDIEIQFSKFCSLRPKNVFLMKDTPSEHCKCVIHENFILKLKALKIGYSNDWWGKVLCDPQMDSKCWNNECDDCSNGKKIFVPDLSQICFWKEWKKTTDKKLRLSIHETCAGELLEMLINSMPSVMSHVNLKRIQAFEFQIDKLDENVRVLQVDFVMPFSCDYQNEVQSVHWSKSSVLLLTAASFYRGQCKTYIVCSDTKATDKDTVYVFLNKLFQLMNEETEEPTSEVIWSDGPSSEFKNKFMIKLMTTLSEKYKKNIYWKYFASSHGKKNIDGIGGNIKRLVRQYTMNQDKNVTVQSAKDFSELSSELVPETRVIYIPSSEIAETITTEEPWDNVKAVPEISNIHWIEANGKSVKCKKNCLSEEITAILY